MKVPADQRSSPTFNVDLATATVELVERACCGVVHVAGPAVADRDAFAPRAYDAFGPSARPRVPGGQAAPPQPAAGPRDAGPPPRPWQRHTRHPSRRAPA